MDLISMTCRTCGGKLRITKDTEQCICQHCGTEYLVYFNEGGITINLLSEDIQKIQASSDKTASELALTRIKKEKEEILGNCLIVEVVCIDTKIKNDLFDRAYELMEQMGPTVFVDILQQALKLEKSKMFKNQRKIKEIEDLILEFDEYAKSWNELARQEALHRRIVNQT